MKAINTAALREQLKSDIRHLLMQAQQLQHLNEELLQQAPPGGGWSVAQVLEHLNIYARYYLPAIETHLHLHQTKPATVFHSGWLGNYFTNLMKPGEQGLIARKMKAPSNAIPSAGPHAPFMLDEFIHHQHQLLNLLDLSATAHLGKIRIPTSLSKMIRLKLGDTFRFVIAHQQRHFVQISNILKTKGLSI